MINLENMNRQHKTIWQEVIAIETEVKKGKDAMNTGDIALHINKLSGQLKIHLLEEDKFLYPNIAGSKEEEVKKLAKEYMEEMGSFAEKFQEYKNAYNLSSKINSNVDEFLRATKEIMNALKSRITKEDNQLYKIIIEKNI